MKCPKCGYLGFETGDRCRNCGYDFSLAFTLQAEPEMPLRSEVETAGPLVDLALAGEPSRARRGDAASEPGAAHPRPRWAVHGESSKLAAPTGAEASPGTTDLPLFQRTLTKDADGLPAPLIGAPGPPRPPLAVRRPTPEAPRPRHRVSRSRLSGAEPALDLASPAPDAKDVPRGLGATPGSGQLTAVASMRRVMAGAVDIMILVAIDATVLYLTLRLCGLQVAEIAIVPVLPMSGFLLCLNAGYLVAFTAAGGQTIGKMAAGIRVVSDNGGRVRLGRAMARAVAWIVSGLPAGLGFLSALGGQGRALHDRVAGTRVIRVSP